MSDKLDILAVAASSSSLVQFKRCSSYIAQIQTVTQNASLSLPKPAKPVACTHVLQAGAHDGDLWVQLVKGSPPPFLPVLGLILNNPAQRPLRSSSANPGTERIHSSISANGSTNVVVHKERVPFCEALLPFISGTPFREHFRRSLPQTLA